MMVEGTKYDAPREDYDIPRGIRDVAGGNDIIALGYQNSWTIH
jgi:hypothetical protein